MPQPLDLGRRPFWLQAAAIFGGMALLALSSRAELPMVPVPMTLQTLAVLLIGSLYGLWWGGVTVASWLTAGALGAPAFSGGASGFTHLIGPTGGYLFGFLIAAVVTGWLAERGWNGARPMLAFAAMIFGHAICLTFGAVWLARSTGLADAITGGVTPFMFGAVVKSAAGAALLYLLWLRTSRASSSAASGGEHRKP